MVPSTQKIGSYWEATVDELPQDPSLQEDVSVDFAIVGAGFTGLSAARRLAEHGHSVAVLEAKHVGWGASGRNGGFCCFGGTKKSEAELVRLYGLEEAKAFVRYQCEAIETVRARMDDWGVHADRHSNGEVILAHRKRDVDGFAAEAVYLKETFGLSARVLSKSELQDEGLAGPEFYGGFHVAHGFALNPMKYVLALAQKARETGVQIFGGSPVNRLSHEGAKWRLETGGGTVNANKVILAGNGYRDETLPKWLYGRTLPVMSSVHVTRPLTDTELADQGWTSDLMAADTRILLHYFRLMPDRRFLFGTRGGLMETSSSLEAMKNKGRKDFERMFPAWRHAESEHSWYGHVCLSWNLTPFVGEIPESEGVYTAMAWHGSGIAMASLSGEKVADLACGHLTSSDIPAVMRAPFRRFPFPPLRLAYLQLAYWWYGLRDRM